MKTFNPLRILARSPRWQILYARSKEVSGIKLFANEYDFTPLQLVFLQWLETYHSLEIDLATNQNGLIRDVLDDEIRTDAYLYCRSRKDKKEEKSEGSIPSHIPSVVFRKGK
jgi:hypothetical protein